jgi:hypothetical protein
MRSRVTLVLALTVCSCSGCAWLAAPGSTPAPNGSRHWPVGVGLPRVLRATRERACPRVVLTPGPFGTRLAADEIGARSATTGGVVYSLADRGRVFGTVYPAVSRDDGRSWRVDGPCFFYAAAQGANVASNVGATAPRSAFVWGRFATYVRVTRDGGRHWWETNFPGGVRLVRQRGHTLLAWAIADKGTPVVYASLDGGLVWRRVTEPGTEKRQLQPRLHLPARRVVPGQLIHIRATGCSPLTGQRDEMTWHNSYQSRHPHADDYVAVYGLDRVGDTISTWFRIPQHTRRGPALLDMYCGDASSGSAVAYLTVE